MSNYHSKSGLIRGPRKKIVGEESIKLDGEELFDLYEVLSCGHRQILQSGEDGMSDANERCCKGCRDGLPTGPGGEVNEKFSATY